MNPQGLSPTDLRRVQDAARVAYVAVRGAHPNLPEWFWEDGEAASFETAMAVAITSSLLADNDRPLERLWDGATMILWWNGWRHPLMGASLAELDQRTQAQVASFAAMARALLEDYWTRPGGLLDSSAPLAGPEAPTGERAIALSDAPPIKVTIEEDEVDSWACEISAPSRPFESELRDLLNRYSREAGSGTPDHILAGYLAECMDAFDRAVRCRERWYVPTVPSSGGLP